METITLISRMRPFCWRRFWANLKAHDLLLPTLGFIFIAAVSVYDTYLVTIEEHILWMEKNPICATLIRLEPNGFTFFICGKVVGALMVIFVLMKLHRIGYRYANYVTGSIAAFQLFLLVYLHLSDPLLGGLPNFALLFNGGR